MNHDSRPNILFVFTDQQWAGMMSCAGNRDLATPGMDSLAARGTRFDRAYCAQPLCVPSRGAMSTGRYPHEIGIPFNFHAHERQARDGLDWVARLIADAGYDTGYIGKWHQPLAKDRADVHGIHDLQECPDLELPRRCDAYLAQRRDRPFFLTVSILDPHDCCEYARGADLLGGNLPEPPPVEDCPELPPNFAAPDGEPSVLADEQAARPGVYINRSSDTDRWRRYCWAYARLTERADGYVSRLLHSLEAHGHRDHTVVVFASDHGDGNAAHRWNQKQALYNESIHVPLIVVDPTAPTTPTRRVESALVSTGLDLLPTFCDYANATVPEGLAGRSLRPFVDSEDAADRRDHVVIETGFGTHSHPNGARGHAVVSDRFKYTLYNRGENRQQLIDLHNDPGEMHNLVDLPEHADTLRRHAAWLDDWAKETDADLGPPVGD
ncbi:MAG: sulfatase-like hydrolase/transferase [Planctomycetota bacterium]